MTFIRLIVTHTSQSDGGGWEWRNLVNKPTLNFVTVTGKHGSNYRLSLSCNKKSKKLNLTNLFNSQQ